MKKKRNILILLLIGLLFCVMPFCFGKLFGSNMDWINQHIVFADYFRNLFYETGELVPNIAWNLGLGQNIYNFSYYGLLSPIILLSYLFPFISMTNYIMISNIVLYLLSIYLFYKWINPKFNNKLTFLLTFIFMCSAPLFYQFHRQIMFVNYIPFLLLCFLEIDKNKRNSLFLITLFMSLMIFTNYYYSVGGILCILFYYIYVHFKDKTSTKLKIILPIIISLLLSGIILIPTLYTILSGRNNIKSSVDFFSLIIPNLSFTEVLYGPYTLGLIALLIPTLIALLINEEKKNIYLGTILSLLIISPIFRYLLNGGLYIRSKALIPFLPLFVFSIGIFLKNLINKKHNYKLIIKITLIISLLGLIMGHFNFGYYLDLILSIIIIYLFVKGKHNISFILIMLEIFIMFIAFNLDENYVDKDYYLSHDYQTEITKVLDRDKSFYRFANTIDPINTVNVIPNSNYFSSSLYSSTYNYNYYNFYHNILNVNNDTYNHLMLVDTDNIIMNRLFGVKYILSPKKLNFGYTLINNNEDYYLYKNDYALSLGYATNKLYSKDSISNYEYPYNLEALLTGIVVDNYGDFVPSITNIFTGNYSFSLGDNISISNSDHWNILEVTKDSIINVRFEEPIINKLLFIEIRGLEKNTCDTELSIDINGIRNRLTCKEWNYPNKNNTFHFLITDNNIETLSINISKGTYKITDIKIYTMDHDILNNKFDLMNNIKINDNKVTGDIMVSSDGYMTLSIPYDSGFTVKVDKKKVDYESVNGGFIGFKLNKGYHNIEIIYENPYFKMGIISSISGIISAIIFLIILNFKSRQKDVDN